MYQSVATYFISLPKTYSSRYIFYQPSDNAQRIIQSNVERVLDLFEGMQPES